MDSFNPAIVISVVVATIVPVIVQFITSNITKVVNNIHVHDWISRWWRWARGIHTITIKSKQYTGKDMQFGTDSWSRNVAVIESIMRHLLDSGVHVSTAEYKLFNELVPVCINTVTHDGDQYTFYTSIIREDSMIISERNVDITTKKSVEVMKKLIDSWYKKYHGHDDDKNIYIYFYDEDKTNDPNWSRFVYDHSKTFDDVFFNQKANLIRDLDRLEKGSLQKICACLHGPPGTGKTSVIKAIAAHTKRHIFVINLKKVTSNENLMSAIFSSMVQFDGHWAREYSMKEKMIIFEDIDADDDIVMQRSDTKSDNVDSTTALLLNAALDKTGMDPPSKRTLTLQGILTILDGIIPIVGGIVIMTTNHYSKLDEALVRPGRVTHNIHMGNLDVEPAHAMVRHHLKSDIDHDYDGKLCSMTPSALEVLCLAANSTDDLIASLAKC